MTNENQTETSTPIEAFQRALPPQGKELSATIFQVAESLNLDPCILAGVIARESDYGSSLIQDCGDWTARQGRYLVMPGCKVVREPPLPEGWMIQGKGPWAIPSDEFGWNRGVMQIDWIRHRTWLERFNWRDPAENIRFGAENLAKTYALMASQGVDDDACVLAAYNAGSARVLRAIEGVPREQWNPDAVTTGGDYSVDVLQRAAAIRSALEPSIEPEE